MIMMISPKRLHPVAAVLKFFRSLRELALPLFIFFFIGGRGGGDKLFDTLYASGVILIVVFMLIYGILTWFRFTYRVEAGELRIEHGVLLRKKRYIPLERIQTIDITEGIVQRLFGLVKVQIETAGGGKEAEAILSAITKEEAEQLRKVLTKEGEQMIEEHVITKDVFTLSTQELFILASTSGGIGVIISALFAFLTQFDELLPVDDVYNIAREVIQSGVILIAIGILVVVFISWMFSIVSTAIKFGNYTLIKKGNELVISRGLLEKREITIPTRKIQAIRIQENAIRQLLGYATVYLEVDGGGNDEKGEYSTVLFPIVRAEKLNGYLRLFTPDFLMDVKLVPLPTRAKKRYVLRLLLPSVIVVTILSYFLHPWGLISLLLLPVSIVLSLIMHREAGFAVSEKHLKLRYRFINRHTVLARKNRIQALHLIHSYFQRTENLASIAISTQSKMAGKHFKIADVDEHHASSLYKWYSYEGKQPR
jgi:putative membrane protein